MRVEGEGIVLSIRPCGERGAVWALLCERAGKICGYAERSKKIAAQPGYLLHYVWNARTEEQLGRFSFTPHRAWTAAATHPLLIYAMRTLPRLADKALAERDPCPESYRALYDFFENAAARPQDISGHVYRYFRAEAGMLRAMGYGLSADRCAFSGCDAPPVFLSLKTGRGACAGCGAPYKHKVAAPKPGVFSMLRNEAHAPHDFTVDDALSAAAVFQIFWEKSVFDRSLDAYLPERALFIGKLAKNKAFFPDKRCVNV